MKLVKICGLTNLDDAKSAVRYGADALGFIFAKSPRCIEPSRAKEIIDYIKNDYILTVGVFVNEDSKKVKEIADYCGLNTLQLHGEESPDYCNDIGDYGIIKSFRMKDQTVLETITAYKRVFAYLLDTYSANEYGGTGKSFDWGLAVKAKSYGMPIILSGGIGLHNVEEAVKTVRPYGIDISSSIERSPGIKDKNKMKELIGYIKSLDSKE
ncbi:MAG: phosphoribosylanthranilate isomerase [Candidatus Omnitrophica bacterium]|nr:phosphoribosylanthranilate isomerase [Candidatus Omnitrophota bacterium]